MATLTVTNSSGADVYCSDLYTTIPDGGSVSTTRSASDFARMAGLQALIAAGTVAVAISYSADEKASGLVDQGDVSASQGAGGLSDMLTIRKAITAGAGGSADDVTVFALNSLPFAKMRVLDAYMFVSAGNAGGRTVSIRTATAGGGTLLAAVDCAAAGRRGQTATVTATTSITNGSTVGLFARRSDSAIAGELVLVLRTEV